MADLISDGPDGATATKLEDMTNEQLLSLAAQGSEEAAQILKERRYGHQQ